MMSAVGNEVRVFLSSTFKDFVLERDLIHERVLPAAEAVCEHYGLRFFLSDLRYGVTERDGTAHRTGELCLAEVRHCVEVSPELNFICLLGHRYGTRLLPGRFEREGFLQLIAALSDRGPVALRATKLLLRVYDPEGFAGWVHRRKGAEASTAAAEFADADELLELFHRLAPAGPAEPICRMLGSSLTHLEALHAGAHAGSPGAIALLRDRVDTLTSRADDAGARRAAQDRLRRTIGDALGDRAVHVEQRPDGPGGTYEASFTDALGRLLQAGIERARDRGTRSHHFFGLTRARAARPAAPRMIERARILGWLADPRPARLAIAGRPGRYRASLLEELHRHALGRAEGPRPIYLDLTGRPELSDQRTFTLAILAALGRGVDLEKERDEALLAKLIAAVREEAAARPVLLLVEGIEQTQGDSKWSFEWLWRGLPGLLVAVTCERDHDRLAGAAGEIMIVEIEARDGEARRELIGALLDGAGVTAAQSLPALDALMLATQARPLPDYVINVVEAYVQSGGHAEAGWDRTDPDGFYAAHLRFLIARAPFPAEVCHAFLGLASVGASGVTEGELLGLFASWGEVRHAVAEVFAIDLPSGAMPSLVWHRLRDHFDGVLCEVAYSEEVATLLAEPYRGALAASASPALRAACEDRLVEQLWERRASPTARSVSALPELLARRRDHGRLLELCQVKQFLAKAIEVDHGRSIIAALRDVPEQVAAWIPEILESREAPGESLHEHSHWLLDLNIILRSVGQGSWAALLGERAAKLRQEMLPAAHPLVLAAVVVLTVALLEARNAAAAERWARDFLEPLAAEGRAAPGTPGGRQLDRLRANLAAALCYQDRNEEAVVLSEELLRTYRGDDRDHFLASIHNGLAVCRYRLGALDTALHHADLAVELTALTRGSTSVAIGPVLVNRSMILSGFSRVEEAIADLERAIAIYDASLDRAHPWRLNALVGLFRALGASVGASSAIERIAVELTGLTVHDALMWAPIVIQPTLDEIERGGPAARTLLASFADVFERGLETASRTAARAYEQLGMQIGVSNNLDQARYAGLCITLMFAFVYATEEGAFPRARTIAVFRRFESILKREALWRWSLRELEDQIRATWAELFAARDPAAYTPALRTLIDEASIAEEPDAETERSREPDEDPEGSILYMEARLETALARGADANELGQLWIVLSSRYLVAGQLDKAIASQKEALKIAAGLFGTTSGEYLRARLNLGSIMRQAGMTAEAVVIYNEALVGLAQIGATFEQIGGSVEKLFELALREKQFGATAPTLDVIAHHMDAPPSVALMGSAMWLQAGEMERALRSLALSVGRLAQLSPSEPGWFDPLARIATALLRAGLTERQTEDLRRVVRELHGHAIETGAEANLRANASWTGLVQYLGLDDHMEGY